jgi:nucleoside-diphosphate-sugar epimerase
VKIAITGATGFIGRHVVSELDRREISATLLMRPSAALPDLVANHHVVSVDLYNSPSNLYELMGAPDILIHLAWGGLPHYKSLHHFEDELPAQFRFLKGLIESGLQNLVVTGTCFEYGMPSGPLSEILQPQPTNPYGFAKNILRCQLEYLQQIKPFNMTWARLFYLYGDGQAENSLLPQLKRAVEQREKTFNMSGGEQLRDYLSATEVAQHLVTLATMLKDNGIVNICSGNPISVRNLVEGWIRKNDWLIELNLGYYPYPDYEALAFWGDREKLDQCLEVK